MFLLFQKVVFQVPALSFQGCTFCSPFLVPQKYALQIGARVFSDMLTFRAEFG